MLILSLFLAGCVSGHNSGTSDGIEIYIPSSSSIEKSQSKASAHCIKYGKKAVSPIRKLGETWEQAYQRTCIDEAPEWIKERATEVRKRILQTHSRHSAIPLPDVSPCYVCKGSVGSWKKLCEAMYLGDPFSMKMIDMPYVEPEVFRKGSGYWDGKPSF